MRCAHLVKAETGRCLGSAGGCSRFGERPCPQMGWRMIESNCRLLLAPPHTQTRNKETQDRRNKERRKSRKEGKKQNKQNVYRSLIIEEKKNLVTELEEILAITDNLYDSLFKKQNKLKKLPTSAFMKEKM